MVSVHLLLTRLSAKDESLVYILEQHSWYI
jgi:hypothetical protein